MNVGDVGDPKRFARWIARARVVLYVALFGLAIVFAWRYDVVSLPGEGCSPLTGLEPGDRLLLDVHPVGIEPGDAVLFRGPEGTPLLGRVADPPPSAPDEVFRALADGALWLVSERAGCPSPDSIRLGPIDRERVLGRVALVLPW